MENIWKREFSVTDEGSDVDSARGVFIAATEGELISSSHTLTSTFNVTQVADATLECLSEGRIVFPSNENSAVIQGDVGGHPVFVGIIRKDISGDAASTYWAINNNRENFDDTIHECFINATAHRDAIQHIFSHLKTRFGNDEYAKITWWYRGDHGVDNKNTFLPPLKTKLLPEFYPDIESGPLQFLKDYMKSSASILLITGQPGTGKTTLLRHLIADFKLTAHVIYDEALMEKDSIFQSFLFGKGNLMIIEDADTLLASREHDKNKLMSRFLNVSDGLIKMPDKKLVFTTNITDFGRVDPALTRPGRCFGVLHTRALNLDEAQAAARVAKVPIPMERKEYTLAQLFNQSMTEQRVRKIGFAS